MVGFGYQAESYTSWKSPGLSNFETLLCTTHRVLTHSAHFTLAHVLAGAGAGGRIRLSKSHQLKFGCPNRLGAAGHGTAEANA